MALYGNMQMPSKGSTGGALPTRQAPEGAYVVGQSQSARLSAAGGAAAAASEAEGARALGNFGQSIGKFSKLGLEIHEKNEQIDLAKAQAAYARMQEEGIQVRERLSQLQGEAAIGADGKPDVEAQWQDWVMHARGRFSKGLGNRGLWYFQQHADGYGAEGAAWASRHVNQELGRFMDQQLNLAIDAEGKSIAADLSGASWEQSLGRLHALNEQRARRLGWTDEMLAEANRAIDAKAAAAGIGVAVSMGKLDEAQALVGKFGKLLSPEEFAKLQTQYSSQTMALAMQKASMGDTDGVRALAGGGGPGGAALNAGIAAASARRKGTAWVMGGSSEDGKAGDCANHVRNIIGHAAPTLKHLFQGTAADIYGKLAAASGASFVGEPQIMMNLQPGVPMALFVDGRAHSKGRLNGIGHIALAFQREDGSWVVSEALRKGSTEVPLKSFMNREGKHTIYGVPLPQAPGMAKGAVMQRAFGLSPKDQLHLQALQMQSEAGNLAQNLMDQYHQGTLSEADLYRQAAAIKDPSVRASVHRAISDMRAIDRIEAQEAMDKSNQAVGARIEELQALISSNPGEGVQATWKQAKDAQTYADAHPEDKTAQAAARQYKAFYAHVSGGRSLATDPQAFLGLMDGIANGTILSEQDLQKSEAYNSMAHADKAALKKALTASKKVDLREAKEIFRSTVGNPDTQVDKNKKKSLQLQEKAFLADVVRMAGELNLGGNTEWLKKMAVRHASPTVLPGLWDENYTYGEDRTSERRGETFPDATDAQLKAAGEMLGAIEEKAPWVIRDYMNLANKWASRHGSLASQKRIAQLMFLRSQQEAELRNGRPPARPEGADIPESAQWTCDKEMGWGWSFIKDGKKMFYPFIYVPEGEE